MSHQRAVRVLLAEDEANLGQIVETFLTGRGYSVLRVADGRAAVAALDRVAFDVAVLDVLMPEVDGLDVLRRAHERVDPPAVVIVTGNATVETSVTALALGAYDVLTKPYRMAQLDALVRRAAEVRRLARRAAAAARGGSEGDASERAAAEIVAHDPVMRTLVDATRRSAGAGTPLLLAGPPGSGRSTLARARHRWSSRAAAPAIVITASGDADTDADALFGRWRDAPAAADPGALAGALELADGGTLVVRGSDRLAPVVQRELAEAMHTGNHRRRGDGRLVASEVALVFTASESTEIDSFEPTLAALLQSLRAERLAMPPLDARRADIVPLARRLLVQRYGRRAPALSEDAARLLETTAWPGNVAELRLVVLLAAARVGSSGQGIDVATLRDLVRQHAAEAEPIARVPAVQSMAALERTAIVEALGAAGWHQGKAAGMLGLSPRTLYRKIRSYGLERPGRTRSDAEDVDQ